VMSGYWADAVATAQIFRSGWLRTHDLGTVDGDGRLIVFARRSDLIVSGGENVYPAEVERALATHAAIAEVAVVPWGDARWGQVPIAALVLRAKIDVAAELRRSKFHASGSPSTLFRATPRGRWIDWPFALWWNALSPKELRDDHPIWREDHPQERKARGAG